MQQVKKPDEYPTGPHFIVIEFHEVTEDSGWGSENNSRVSAPQVYVTVTRDDWIAHINALEGAGPGRRVPPTSPSRPRAVPWSKGPWW